MKKYLAILTLALTAATTLATTPASAEGIESTDVCPQLSDSVVRLYSAYFLRAPDAGGLAFWLSEYSEGRRSLAPISQHFSESTEFIQLYGSLTNRQFIDLIYQNILGRAGEQTGVDFWTGRLDQGIQTRGEVMLSFSESREYVAISNTALPLAGYFQWYPEGTTWYCGTDDRAIPFSPSGPFYADGFAELGFDEDTNIEENFIVRTEDTQSRFKNSLVNERVLEGEYVMFWNGHYETAAQTRPTGFLEVDGIDSGRDTFRWAVVIYPTSIGTARGGLGDLETTVSHGDSLVGCTGCR